MSLHKAPADTPNYICPVAPLRNPRTPSISVFLPGIMTEIPPSHEHLLVPFETRLLGRVVLNPNRPMHDYLDCRTVPLFTKREISNIQQTVRSRLHPQRQSDSTHQNPPTNTVTVRATLGSIYEVPNPPDWWGGLYPGYRFRKVLTDAGPFGDTLYVITGLQIVQDYSITPESWAGYGESGMSNGSTKLGASGVPPANRGLIRTRVTSSADHAPDSIVISMKFTVLTGDPSVCGNRVMTSLLDWQHNPHYTPVIESDVGSGGSLAPASLLDSSRASKSDDDGSRGSSLDDDGSRAISAKDDRSRAFSLHADAERLPGFRVAIIPENSPEHIPDEPNVSNEPTIDPNIHQSSPLSHLTVPLGTTTDPTSGPSVADGQESNEWNQLEREKQKEIAEARASRQSLCPVARSQVSTSKIISTLTVVSA